MKSQPQIKKFERGQYLFRENEESHCLYIIQKGMVSVRKYRGTSFVEVARLCGNEVLGELTFFDRQPRSASALALTEVEAVEVQFESLDKIYDTIPPYMKTIISSIADRLRRANDMIQRLQKRPAQDLAEGSLDNSPVEPDSDSEPNDSK